MAVKIIKIKITLKLIQSQNYSDSSGLLQLNFFNLLYNFSLLNVYWKYMDPVTIILIWSKTFSNLAGLKLLKFNKLIIKTLEGQDGFVFECIFLAFQNESDSNVNEANPHIANIGKMVEVRSLISLLLCDKPIFSEFSLGHN